MGITKLTMAAARTCIRPLRQILTRFSGTGIQNNCNRSFSTSSSNCNVQKTKEKVINVGNQWRLFGAVCLQRLPVLSQERNPIEEKFFQLTNQMELEKSLFSEHELRLLEEADRFSRKKEADYDSDEEDSVGQDIITAQDLEDTWEQKLKQFQPLLRFEDMVDMDFVDRCLRDSLVLLVKQQVGSEELWLLPQLQWESGESLRQTAERALANQPGADFKATFLGNAPCGVYKYKFPKDIRTESCVGAMVFFFKAVLSSSSYAQNQKGSFVWAKKSELQDYLKPEYLKQVNRFVMNL